MARKVNHVLHDIFRYDLDNGRDRADPLPATKPGWIVTGTYSSTMTQPASSTLSISSALKTAPQRTNRRA